MPDWGAGAGVGVGAGVGAGVGSGVGSRVGSGAGKGAGKGVGVASGLAVGAGAGSGVGAGAGGSCVKAPRMRVPVRAPGKTAKYSRPDGILNNRVPSVLACAGKDVQLVKRQTPD